MVWSIVEWSRFVFLTHFELEEGTVCFTIFLKEFFWAVACSKNDIVTRSIMKDVELRTWQLICTGSYRTPSSCCVALRSVSGYQELLEHDHQVHLVQLLLLTLCQDDQGTGSSKILKILCHKMLKQPFICNLLTIRSMGVCKWHVTVKIRCLETCRSFHS